MTANEVLRQISMRQSARTVNLNPVVAGAVAGFLVGGSVLGGGARLAMRMVALLAGQRPEFSIMGTLAILIVGAIVGTIAGLVYLFLRLGMPEPASRKGVIYGGILAVLVALPFFLQHDGETGLVAPWIGASLFASVALVYGFVLALVVARFERRLATKPPRAVCFVEFATGAMSVVFAMLRMFSVVDDSLPTPPALRALLEGLGIDFADVGSVQGLLGLGFVLIYCALCVMIFWLGYRNQKAKVTAISLLVFAGLFFNTKPLLSGLAHFTPGDRVEWMALLLLALGLTSSVMVQWRLGKLNNAAQRQARGWLLASVALSAYGFLLTWTAILLVPSLQLRGLTGFYTALSVSPYLAPWLLLPFTLVLAMLRYNLWAEDDVSSETEPGSKATTDAV